TAGSPGTCILTRAAAEVNARIGMYRQESLMALQACTDRAGNADVRSARIAERVRRLHRARGRRIRRVRLHQVPQLAADGPQPQHRKNVLRRYVDDDLPAVPVL